MAKKASVTSFSSLKSISSSESKPSAAIMAARPKSSNDKAAIQHFVFSLCVRVTCEHPIYIDFLNNNNKHNKHSILRKRTYDSGRPPLLETPVALLLLLLPVSTVTMLLLAFVLPGLAQSGSPYGGIVLKVRNDLK